MVPSNRNFKKYLGISNGEDLFFLCSPSQYTKGGWLDHRQFGKVKNIIKDIGLTKNWEFYDLTPDDVVFMSEPYEITIEALESITKLCQDFNLSLHIDGRSTHNPGQCLRIIVWKETSERRNDNETKTKNLQGEF